MAYIHAGRRENFYLGKTIHAGRRERFRFTNGMHAGRRETFTLKREVVAARRERFTLFSEALHNVYEGVQTPGLEWVNYCAPILISDLTLKNGDTVEDLSPYLVRMQLKKHLGGKTMINFDLRQYGSTFTLGDTGPGLFSDKLTVVQPDKINPFYVGFGDPNGRMVKHNFSTRTTLQLLMRYGYDQTGYEKFYAPTMLPLEPEFDGHILRWSGEDFAGLLEQENLTTTGPDGSQIPVFKDINADAASSTHGLVTSHAAIREMCAYKGITNVVIEFPAYTIRLLRRNKGNILNWVDMICRIYQAKRHVVGNTMYFRPTLPPHLGKAKWTFIENVHISQGDFSVKQDLSNYRNKFTIIRVSPNGGIIGEQECIGPQCVGRTGNITFDIPVTAAAATVEVTNGVIEDYVYFDEYNNPVFSDSIYALGPSGPTYLGAIPSGRVEFTYRASVGMNSFTSASGGPTASFTGGQYNQTPGTTAFGGNIAGQFAYTPRYKVVFYGRLDSQIGLDNNYNFTVEDSQGIVWYGLYQEDDIEDQIIPNKAVALAYAQAMLRESTRKVWFLRFKTRFVNPKIEPGDICTIQDLDCKLNNVKWLIEEVTITDANGTAEMEILASRGGEADV